MPVTLTVAELAAAMRVGSSAEETAEVTRLLAFSSLTVEHHAEGAPDAIHNEAAIRIASYVYDQPGASSRSSFANALRNSGAARMMLPWRVHKVGSMSAGACAATTQTAPLPGWLELLGTEQVAIAAAHVWAPTGLDAPTADYVGIQIRFPDGTNTGLATYYRPFDGESVFVAGETTPIQSAWAYGRNAAGGLLLASAQSGAHTLTLWSS